MFNKKTKLKLTDFITEHLFEPVLIYHTTNSGLYQAIYPEKIYNQKPLLFFNLLLTMTLRYGL